MSKNVKKTFYKTRFDTLRLYSSEQLYEEATEFFDFAIIVIKQSKMQYLSYNQLLIHIRFLHFKKHIYNADFTYFIILLLDFM